MSEEEKVETTCFCKSKAFRKFLVIALGTFVGVYAALSLFAATHRPPVMPPCPMGFGAPAPVAAPCPFKHHHRNFLKDNGGFHKEFKGPQGPAPFDADRTQK